MSRGNLPPLGSLVAFESVARTLSITLSATELSLTQSAVSKQIARLENIVGTELFSRDKMRLSLTERGKIYLDAAKPVLESLVKLNEARSAWTLRPRFRLAIPPTFACIWLLPRLKSFQEAHPEISLEIDSFLKRSDLALHEYDAVIDFHQSYADDHLDVIAKPEFVAVCSRSYSPPPDREISVIRSKSFPDILDLWLGKNPATRVGKVTTMNDFSTAETASINGIGIAILPRFIVEPNIAAGHLKLYPSSPVISNAVYAYTRHSEASESRTSIVFRKWLIAEAEKTFGRPRKMPRIDLAHHSAHSPQHLG